MTMIIDGSAGATFPDSKVQGVAFTSTQSGSAPMFAARAWCVFDGTLTGTNAPTAGGNVTSVTRNGVGDYTVNFTTAIQDANYCVVAAGNQVAATSTRTTTTTRVVTINTTTGSALDSSAVHVAIFR